VAADMYGVAVLVRVMGVVLTADSVSGDHAATA
jgi:hypothetical protein